MTILILDRDGVINHDSPDFIKSEDEWLPIAGSLEAIARASQAGWRVVVATNQSGLGRGLFDEFALARMHEKFLGLVEERGGRVEGIFYCPHAPEAGCDCRKPKTGLLSAIEESLGESLRGMPFVGDSLRDLQSAVAYSCRPILVTTGKGADTLARLGEETALRAVDRSRQGNPAEMRAPGNGTQQEVEVFDDLAAAVDSLLR